jgi:hypothetical protein
LERMALRGVEAGGTTTGSRLDGRGCGRGRRTCAKGVPDGREKSSGDVYQRGFCTQGPKEDGNEGEDGRRVARERERAERTEEVATAGCCCW